jgi:hypothetical protein
MATRINQVTVVKGTTVTYPCGSNITTLENGKRFVDTDLTDRHGAEGDHQYKRIIVDGKLSRYGLFMSAVGDGFGRPFRL